MGAGPSGQQMGAALQPGQFPTQHTPFSPSTKFPTQAMPNTPFQMPWMPGQPQNDVNCSGYEKLTKRFGHPKPDSHGSNGYATPVISPDFQQMGPQNQMTMMMMPMIQQQGKRSSTEEEKEALKKMRSRPKGPSGNIKDKADAKEKAGKRG